MFTATGEGGDARRTIARVWHVTLDHLTDTPLAGTVSRVPAWWASDQVPRDFLAGLGTEPDMHEALGRLAAHSMISLTGSTVSVHRLVQAVTRTPADEDPHRLPGDIASARDTATTTLATALDGPDPWSPADWPTYRLVLPHARALLDHTTTDTATTHHARATHSRQRLLGPDHLDSLTSRNNLAVAYGSAGDLGRAIPLHEATLTDCERALGPDHPTTKIIRQNLGQARRT
ncbi:tetratricopeptide repeat protein [Actinosynnema sp. NPDC020468]|uniref:tetratricopeptide repeat protein n=1 Tax=Actinosynnema sp. NPDC020468 TaxID=3154488 RepID=UPI0033CCD8BE